MAKFKLNRRDFIKYTTGSLFLSGLPIPGHTKEKPPGNISVIILEGGMDGLTAVPPIGDPSLIRLREILNPTKPLKLNPFFGLHPKLDNFARLMAKNNASVVHATSFPYVKRSHFEGQNFMEGGGLSPFSEHTGWLGRALDLANLPGRALALDMPLILRGHQDVDNFYPAKVIGSKKPEISLINSIALSHKKDEADVFFKVSNKLQSKTALNIPRDPVSLAKYAGEEMAKLNGPVASVIRINEFDTHAVQGSDEGNHPRQLKLVDEVIGAYHKGLGDAWDRSIILTLTEFGRTVAVNGTEGTDHGYGSAGLIAGGLITKASIVSQWPGLAKNEQFEQRDLMATIDYRSVCSACIEKALGLEHDKIASEVFFTPKLPRVYDYIFS